MNVKSLEKSKKNLLGKYISTFYFPVHGSLRQYENGWIIKPVKQDPIMITERQGHLLARWMRSKQEFFTLKEAFAIARKKAIEKL